MTISTRFMEVIMVFQNALCPGSILLANYFRNCSNRNNWWKNYDKLIYKNRKSNKCNKIQGLEREDIKEGN